MGRRPKPASVRELFFTARASGATLREAARAAGISRTAGHYWLRESGGVRPRGAGVLTLGTDNGSQFTSRDFRKHLSARGITHRRGGYRDPESQAFIESWFGQFKKRCAWRSEWETIEQARKEVRLHRALSRVTAFRACLPDAGGGRRYLAGPDRPTNWSDLI